ncbi:aspartate-semialdehyde dehydrogenase [bacterium]|nr:aspartate-semialdehyde dehydrogenase [bacterium]
MDLRLAIIGATGLVGRELLRIIESKQPPLSALGLYASADSAGAIVRALAEDIEVRPLVECDFSKYDAALFCVGDELSLKHVPAALDAGCSVVDKSNAFRLDPGVPLVVAGVNDDAVTANSRLVANPNCSTIVLAHAIGPLAARFGIARLWVATYQSVSGAGRRAVEGLRRQVEQPGICDSLLAREPGLESGLAFNVIPSIGEIDELGRCSEEAKLCEETRKILGMAELVVIAHSARVPVVIGHGIAVTVELEQPASEEGLLSAWRESSHLRLMEQQLPTPLSAARHEQVEVGRLRQEGQLENGWSFFVCGDNLNIGAALNGWRILGLMQMAGAVPAAAVPVGRSDA